MKEKKHNLKLICAVLNKNTRREAEKILGYSEQHLRKIIREDLKVQYVPNPFGTL